MVKFYYLSLIGFLFFSCNEFPKEIYEYYQNGEIKAKVVFFDKNGKRDIYNYSNDGKVRFEYHWEDSNRNGIYKEYFNTGELNKFLAFKKGNVIESRSYDKNGILYNELIHKNIEKNLLYYSDTSLYEISYLTSVYKNGERVKIIEDSVLTYKGDRLFLKSYNLNDEIYVISLYYDSIEKTDTVRSYGKYRALKDSILHQLDLKPLYEFVFD